MTDRLSESIRALLAGALCLSILAGVLVVHAWPLWTGESALLPVTPIDPRDMFRGEYVHLDTPATRLAIRATGDARADDVVSPVVAVEPVGSWWAELPSEDAPRAAALRGRIVYVQLERRAGTGESHPISISTVPVAGHMNLRGRVSWYERQGERLNVDFGLDRYFMQEGTAKPVEDALRARQRVQMEIAVASSGHARIRQLLVDGVAVGRSQMSR